MALGVCEVVLAEQRIGGRSVQRWGTPAGEGRHPYRLSLTQVIDVGPGNAKQAVHRGNGLWGFALPQTFDPQV